MSWCSFVASLIPNPKFHRPGGAEFSYLILLGCGFDPLFEEIISAEEATVGCEPIFANEAVFKPTKPVSSGPFEQRLFCPCGS